ncbi:hypothetical protein NC652_008517 [Populus alba x Populus x berolinensis]|nr:hypothetical protein NC652_008517 [Populus alba x Populus x berolinensis]
MAVTCFFFSSHPRSELRPVLEPVRKSRMLKQSSHVLLKKATYTFSQILLQRQGPRFHHPLPSSSVSYHSRDAEIINLLQQGLHQIVGGGEFNDTDNGVIAAQEDCNQNGFNTDFADQ